MLFYEPFFALLAFPAFYAIYLWFNDRASAKKWVLILGSIAFYTWGEPLFVPVVLVSALLDYVLSRRLQPETRDGARKAWLVLGIAANLGILVFYKYTDFLIANFNTLLAPFAGSQLPLLKIALPIGVSFVVFEKISYLVDTYRGTSKPARSFSDYCLFVFMFPKLLAGPILKYHEMQDQIAKPAAVTWNDAWEGFLRFSRGIAKKLLIADTCGAFADQAFGANAATLGTGQAWLGVVCFTLQIYFDFSAYSDMAIGLARMLGFRLRENFNMPYAAHSLTDFWRRWHISLTTWIRDYLYKPLGGNRGSAAQTYLNLWICFLLSGVWHGANWNFVLWGAYNGLFLTLDRIFLIRWLDRAGAFVSTIVTLFIVMIGWVIFRATSAEHIAGYLTAMFDFSRAAPYFEIPPELPLAVLVGTMLSLLPTTPLYAPLVRAYANRITLQRLGNAALVALYVIAIARAFAVPFTPFIYFRF
ncbi:MAG: MBOAT family protein [Xanthobacteraceae bacterium]|nr:MBOAT family protein [Xanthobacteraceae bacterium]MBX3533065.1 MBOAT family protein [Xanthobacteraceae bacterium]